ISSVGANKNAKRAAMLHLAFNVIGTGVWISVFCVINVNFNHSFLNEPASLFGIAVAHTIFNILCTILMLPVSGVFEKLVKWLVPDAKQPEMQSELDERLLTTPPIALERCRKVAAEMAQTAVSALKESVIYLQHNDAPELAASIREKEEKTDYYEDILGTYLVKLSAKQISESDSAEAAKLLKIIGDFERISDHAVNILESAEELKKKGLAFTPAAVSELQILAMAISEILDLTLTAFLLNDPKAASMVEPLEQVIDQMKEQLRTRHILRLQKGACSIDVGFVWSDLLTNLERTSDHCSNIAGCVIDMTRYNMNIHESLRSIRNDSEGFRQKFRAYANKYSFSQL
ncbi:MAG: Na/Pi cotransporter family protein, partial [Lachnospiraceae bacterium]|nr:Na/Pi cotransporter family protein [Lachnospiraceae bacterium]